MKTKHFYVSSGYCSHKGLFLSLCAGVLLCAVGIAFAIELPEPFSTGTQGFHFSSGDFNSGHISSQASAGSNISSSGISSGASASSQISWGSSSDEAEDHDEDHDRPCPPVVRPCDPFAGLMGKSVAVIMEDEVVLTGVLQGTCSNYMLLRCDTRTTVINLQKVLYAESL